MDDLMNELAKIEAVHSAKRTYFLQVEYAFISNKDYSIYEKMVFMALSTYAGKKNSCFPGQKGIADQLGISRATVNRTLKKLESKGGLLIINRFDQTGRKASNLYILSDIDCITRMFIKESLDEYRYLLNQYIISK